MTAVSVFFSVVGFFGCAATLSPKIFILSGTKSPPLSLRVLTPVVVVAEEGKNTDNHTHHHTQCQGDPRKLPTEGNLRTKATKKSQDLLHPPVKTRIPCSKQY